VDVAAVTRRRWVMAAGAVVAAAVLAAVVVASNGEGDGDPFCDAFGALLVGPLSDPGTDASDPVSLQAAVEETEDRVDELVDAAPAEAAASARALAAEYRAAFAVVARYGYDLERLVAEATPEEQTVLDGFGSDSGATGDLEEVVADRCTGGVTLTTPVTSP
jgi:hypothetical protein